MLAMVEWARARNAAGAGRVEIVGYDMQDPRMVIDSVLAFLARRDPGFHAAADSAYGPMREAWRVAGYPQRPDSVIQPWLQATDRVRQHLRQRRAQYLASARTAADTAGVAWALQNAEVAYQSASLGDETPGSVRDSAMAANLVWSLAQRPAGTRAIVWAHNYHISRLPGAMGRYLERILPGQVRAFGITGATGEYAAASSWSRLSAERRYSAFPIIPSSPPASSVASVLMDAGWPAAVVDLREARTSPQGAWLMTPRPVLAIGGMAADYIYNEEPLPDAYDFLLFVARTTPSRSLAESPVR
jgi:erythromycin esterase